MPPKRSIFDKLEVGDLENSIVISGDGVELTKKSEKSKSQNLSKSQQLAKSDKKALKSGYSPNFEAKKNGPNFLTPKVRAVFNCLWLAFIKALIF